MSFHRRFYIYQHVPSSLPVLTFVHYILKRPLIHDDKGDYSGCAGHLRCGKGTTWEGGQRVPGMISWPSKIEPGVTHALASTLDIMPTIMSMVGEEVPDVGLSYDLSDLLLNDGDVRINCYSLLFLL